MPPRTLPGHDNVTYYLMSFNPDGQVHDQTAADEVLTQAADAVTDIYLLSHGWKGDIPAAIDQYDRWIGAMADLPADADLLRNTVPDYRSLVIGIHWPSLPWGNEDADAAVLGPETAAGDDFATEAARSPGELINQYAPRIADTMPARDALATILAAADDPATVAALEAGELPPGLADAYRTLFDEADLHTHDALARPGDDQATFDPARSIQEWTTAAQQSDEPTTTGEPVVLGLGDLGEKLRNMLLMPIRQLSFWQMKRRARLIGETGVHALLTQLQQTAPAARIHLMGHSFGCIVVTAAIAGPVHDGTPDAPLPRPVDTLFLVQGAMSLWSYADRVPFEPGGPGYYRLLRQPAPQVRGVIATTQSAFDRAVGTFYPLGAHIAGDVVLGDEGLPKFGAIGAFGIQGIQDADPATPLQIGSATTEYGFLPGQIHNVDASRVICHGSGASGAHSDIAHPEVAHLMWQAVNAAALN